MLSLFTTAKSFRQNRWIGSRAFNRMGLHLARMRLARGISSIQRRWLGSSLSPAQRRDLDQQGFCSVHDFLSADDLDKLRRELDEGIWSWVEMAQPPARTLRINFDGQTCERYPVLGRIIRHPVLLGMLRYAAGCPGAPIAALQIIRTEGAAQGHDPQTDWHRDTFHPVSKAWFFLHDVPASQGPFGYVPGSHRPTPAHEVWEQAQSVVAAVDPNSMHANGSFRASEQELTAMGYGTPWVAAVPANTLIVADTSGFHRRTPSAQPSVRIELYFSLRRNPFFAGLYPSLLGLPIVRHRWAGWAYRYFEKRLAAGRPDWIPLGRRSLADDEKALLRNPQQS